MSCWEGLTVDDLHSVTLAAKIRSLFRRVSMGSKLARVPVLSALPAAYWVNGETGLRQTTDAVWEYERQRRYLGQSGRTASE